MADARLAEIIRNCRNTTARTCGGYLEPTATGQPGAYISTVLLSTGSVDLEQFPGYPFEEDLDQGMAEIVSYDRAECNDSYIGQVNMLQASSFSGVNGAIWGYDLAVDSRIGKTHPVGRIENIPIYSLIPLRDATRQLFGVADSRHFPPQEGAMVVCAEKYRTSAVSDGNMWIWCALGFAIAEDRDNHACLFMEDTGIMSHSADEEDAVRRQARREAQQDRLCGLPVRREPGRALQEDLHRLEGVAHPEEPRGLRARLRALRDAARRRVQEHRGGCGYPRALDGRLAGAGRLRAGRRARLRDQDPDRARDPGRPGVAGFTIRRRAGEAS